MIKFRNTLSIKSEGWQDGYGTFTYSFRDKDRVMETARLISEKFKTGDFDNYFGLVSNEDVMKMISGKAISPEEAQTNFEKILSINDLNSEIGYYTVRKKETDEFIGLYKIIMIENGEAEIGYSLLPDFWNMGYGSEISEELVKYAKTIPQINCLVAITDPENYASKRILKKSGFKSVKICEIDNLPSEIFKLVLKNANP